jgi:hypothetical protein
VSGPREYGTGTRYALFALAQGTCYFPGCNEPVVKAVEGFQTTNVQIAHIRGANPGSARFDASMTDAERARFDNLLLLCKPHHDVVDKLAPSDWPASRLEGVKAGREASGAADALRGQTFTGDALEDMLREVIKDVTVRAVTATFTIAMNTPAGWLSMPVEAVDRVRDINTHLGDTKGAAVTTITNVGMVDSFVADVGIYVRPDGQRGEIPHFTLLGRNDFPLLNPRLPKQLRVGESTTWMTQMSTIQAMVEAGAATGVTFSTVWAQVRLATGETILTQEVAVDSLPRN